jgi:hypothetical protein
VPITLDTISIFYNQPMKNDGGGGSVELPVHYRLRNLDNNQNLPILGISYDPTTWVLSLVFDNTDPDWAYNTPYEVRIQGSIRNICGNPQGGAVTTTFTTQSTATDTPTPTVTSTPTLTSTPLVTDTPTLTPTATATPTSTPTCSPPLPIDGELPDGYVQAIDPADGETNVPVSLDTVFIFYNQPMKNDGGGGSVELPVHYRLRNLDNNHSLPILGVSYDPVTFVLAFVFDNADPDWTYGTLYEVSVQSSVRNICGQPQQGSVVTTFTTESLILASLNPTLEQKPQPTLTPTLYWQIIPVLPDLPVFPTLPPTPKLTQPTFTPFPTQTPAALRTLQPPVIATPTATLTPLPLPPRARVTDAPPSSPTPTATQGFSTRLSSDLIPDSLTAGWPEEQGTGWITGNATQNDGSPSRIMIFLEKYFYIDQKVLTWWSCIFDAGCGGGP